MSRASKTVFPYGCAAEGEVEASVVEPLGDYDGEGFSPSSGYGEAVFTEAEMLEQMPMLGAPKDEREWLKKLSALPKKARVAIRRTHQG